MKEAAKDFDVLLKEANAHLPPIFQIRYEDEKLELFQRIKSNVTDANGKATITWRREMTYMETTNKEKMVDFLAGMCHAFILIEGVVNSMNARMKNEKAH